MSHETDVVDVATKYMYNRKLLLRLLFSILVAQNTTFISCDILESLCMYCITCMYMV